MDEYCRKHIADTDDVSDSMLREYIFQQQKQRKNVLEALEAGTLLPEEVQALRRKFTWQDLANQLGVFQDARARADVQRRQKIEKNSLKCRTHVAGAQRRRSILFYPTSLSTDAVKKALVEHNGAQVSSPQDADLIVTNQIAGVSALPDSMAMCVLAKGAVICDSTYIISGFQRGIAIAYNSCIAKRRYVHFTSEFSRTYVGVEAMIRSINTTCKGQWDFLSEDDFLRRVARVSVATAGSFYLAFVTDSDKSHEKLSRVPKKLTLKEAVAFFNTVDRARCCDNLCGR